MTRMFSFGIFCSEIKRNVPSGQPWLMQVSIYIFIIILHIYIMLYYLLERYLLFLIKVFSGK